MLYRICTFIGGLTRLFFFRKIYINKPEVLKKPGPMILACTHPDAFLDGVTLCTLFDVPVHILTRGDVFKKPRARKILEAINAIPIYRMSEGKENLSLNDETFNASKNVMIDKEAVLIFSEGLCVNEWKLRPLKKGTARLAFQGWNHPQIGHHLVVQPVGISISSYRKFGKRLVLKFGEPITADQFENTEINGKNILEFNKLLYAQLKPNIIEKPEDISEEEFEEKFHTGNFEMFKTVTGFNKVLYYIFLGIPALAGFLLNAPVFFPVRNLARKFTKNSVFYDSVLFGMLLILYPIYCILIAIIVGFFCGIWAGLAAFILLPLLGKITTEVKNI